ncbi:hypothetical protein PG994_012349 [Apiospora phragmitis]|uniref:Uncharacterized protein n=1 Tax=Apiospora phragmitis TaxID=2905665 RepID=A0ABR1TVF0_9PEZI
MAPTISAFKAAGADLLWGRVVYPCDHEFGYILDHTLDRTGDERWFCPKCVVADGGAGGKCLACLQPWDANATESCPHCDAFFIGSGLLEERKANLEATGLELAKDSIGYAVTRSRELQRREARKERLQALAATDKEDS